MKKVFLVFSSMLAALVAGAVFAATASATHEGSTVGSAVCPPGSDVFPCGSSTPLNLEDWGGFAEDGEAQGGQPPHPGNEDPSTYHCNNVFFEAGGGPPVGTQPGTAYYTVGRNPAVDLLAEQDDCDTHGNKELSDSCTAQHLLDSDPCSIVLFRGVGYLNSPTLDPDGDFSQPDCNDPNLDPNRNPGCPTRDEAGKSAGYIGVGRGNEVSNATDGAVDLDIDAGGKGNLP